MSDNLSSKPDRTKKVKYERGEMVDNYESADTLRSAGPEEAPPQTTAGHQRTESVPPQRRSSRDAAVCEGLLCVFLLAGITGLKLYCMTLMKENIREREQSNTRYNNTVTELMKEKQYLVKERDALRKTLNTCCSGWKTFGSSCYHVATERKTWEESRQDCTERGADLVIINSREEMDFIHSFWKSYLWIGLSYSEEEGIWKWVDGTRLSEKHEFWRKGEPNGNKGENCVEQIQYASESPWNDVYCTYIRTWVCEKNTTLYL